MADDEDKAKREAAAKKFVRDVIAEERSEREAEAEKTRTEQKSKGFLESIFGL